MYKVSSDKRQSALHRGRPFDWANGEECLTLEQQHAQLQNECRILETRRLATVGDERKALGLQKAEAQTKLSAIKKQLRNIPRSEMSVVAQIFQRVAKEVLSRPQYEAIFNAATREYRRQEAAREERRAHTESAKSD